MDWANRHPEISLKIAAGCLAAVVVFLLLFVLGRRVPQSRVPAAFLFGLVLGSGVNEIVLEIRQRNLDDRVLSAASKGDARTLLLALKAGGSPDADEPTSGGYPALTLAVDSGNADAVELLLMRGADPKVGDWEHTCVEIARKKGRADLVKLLQRYGAQ